MTTSCKLSLIFAAVAILTLNQSATAQLMIDFGSNPERFPPGYTAQTEQNMDPDVLSSGTYSAFGGSVTVDVSGSNLPDGNLDWRVVNRSSFNPPSVDLVNDWIGIDTRGGGLVPVTLTIKVSGLPPGNYNWLSYHHDGGPDGRADGQADYTFSDSNGEGALVANGITFSSGAAMEATSTFSTPFSITAGGMAQLDIIMLDGQGTVGDTNSIFAFVNGLDITSAPDILLGDVNRDGMVNFLDISPFIVLISGGGFQLEADLDQSGFVNFFDIPPFIVALSGQ